MRFPNSPSFAGYESRKYSALISMPHRPQTVPSPRVTGTHRSRTFSQVPGIVSPLVQKRLPESEEMFCPIRAEKPGRESMSNSGFQRLCSSIPAERAALAKPR